MGARRERQFSRERRRTRWRRGRMGRLGNKPAGGGRVGAGRGGAVPPHSGHHLADVRLQRTRIAPRARAGSLWCLGGVAEAAILAPGGVTGPDSGAGAVVGRRFGVDSGRERRRRPGLPPNRPNLVRLGRTNARYGATARRRKSWSRGSRGGRMRRATQARTPRRTPSERDPAPG